MWRWVVALCLSGVIYVALYHANEEVRNFVVRVVYSTDDFLYMAQWLEEPRTVMTSVQPVEQFTRVQRFEQGFLIEYTEPHILFAKEPGVVVFTGYTAKRGPVISVAYQSGVTVTFGMLDSLQHVPYSTVQSGDVLAQKRAGALYVRIEQHGEVYTLEQTLAWLRND